MTSNELAKRRRLFYIGFSIFIAILVTLLITLIVMLVRMNRSEADVSSSTTTEASAEHSREVIPAGQKNLENDSSADPSLPENSADSSSSKEETSHEETSKDETSKEEGDLSGEETSSENSDESSESSRNNDSSETSEGNDSSESSPNENSQNSTPSVPASASFATHNETMSEDQIHMGVLQLVNKQNEYLFLEDWLIRMYDLGGYGYYLDEYSIEMAEPAAYHMNDFLNAFYDATGIMNVYMMNGFRSAEDADWLFNRSAEENGLEHAMMYVMRAGFSEHHIGCSSDLGLIYGGPYFNAEPGSDYYWIYDHAADYGFVLRYPGHKVDITEIGEETWHFRYVTVPVANYMYRNDLCLEEFEDIIRSYSAADPLKISVTQGPETGDYVVYYQAGTTVPVPDSLDYVISGNNMDGFIVVAKIN